jgi:uncharacterized protein
LIISDFIIYETITFLNASLKNHTLAISFLAFVDNSESIEIIKVDNDIKDSAIGIFTNYQDKYFSFTDCTSFAIMHKYGITNACTFDNHFKQMGFNALKIFFFFHHYSPSY